MELCLSSSLLQTLPGVHIAGDSTLLASTVEVMAVYAGEFMVMDIVSTDHDEVIKNVNSW